MAVALFLYMSVFLYSFILGILLFNKTKTENCWFLNVSGFYTSTKEKYKFAISKVCLGISGGPSSILEVNQPPANYEDGRRSTAFFMTFRSLSEAQNLASVWE